jgi:hypothetical protein
VDFRVQAVATAAAGCGLLVLPAAAGAHSIVRASQGTIAYLASDATSLNTLTVKYTGTDIEFYDPTVDGGIDPGPCRPGELNGRGEVMQVFCTRAGALQVRIDVGEREDTVNSSIDLTTQTLGGPGADRLAAGAGNDVVTGNDGNDVLAAGNGNDNVIGGEGNDQIDAGAGDDEVQAGGGLDTVDAGPGNDTIETPDGIADRVTCGDGADTVDADQLDEVAADCETVRRTFVEPVAGAGGDDRRPPQLAVGGRSVQRVGKRRRFFIAASSSEPGTIAASGFLDVAGLALPLRSNRARVLTAGHGVQLRVRLSKAAYRECLRAWRRGRKVRVRLGVVATDGAGNSTKPKTFRARLLRPR